MISRSFRIIITISIAIIILAVTFTFVLSLFQNSRTTGTQYLEQCPAKWPPQLPGANTSQLETLVAMTMNPDTLAKICAEYNSYSSTSVTAILNGSVYYESNMTKASPSLIQVTAEPQPLMAPVIGGQNPVAVAYALFTISISSSALGFYMLSLPGICPLMPLAVGYDQINYTDFAYGWHHSNQCSSVGFLGSYFSVNNVGVAYSYVPLNDQ